jgi:hypothetical protein
MGPRLTRAPLQLGASGLSRGTMPAGIRAGSGGEPKWNGGDGAGAGGVDKRVVQVTLSGAPVPCAPAMHACGCSALDVGVPCAGCLRGVSARGVCAGSWRCVRAFDVCSPRAFFGGIVAIRRITRRRGPDTGTRACACRPHSCVRVYLYCSVQCMCILAGLAYVCRYVMCASAPQHTRIQYGARECAHHQRACACAPAQSRSAHAAPSRSRRPACQRRCVRACRQRRFTCASMHAGVRPHVHVSRCARLGAGARRRMAPSLRPALWPRPPGCTRRVCARWPRWSARRSAGRCRQQHPCPGCEG